MRDFDSLLLNYIYLVPNCKQNNSKKLQIKI